MPEMAATPLITSRGSCLTGRVRIRGDPSTLEKEAEDLRPQLAIRIV